MTLGQKIKEARISRGITQSDLCRNKITRNMLSAIENDKASPSLDTLLYLSEQLYLPAAYLISNDQDLFFYEKNEAIEAIKESFKEEKYSTCISKITKLSKIDDELAYLLVKCHFALGKHFVFRGALDSAKEHLNKAFEYTSKTIYDISGIKTLIPMYYSLAENIQAPLLNLKVNDVFDSFDPEKEYELLKYIVGDTSYVYKNPQYKSHIRAKELIRKRRFEEAIEVLEAIVSERSTDEYNAYLTFHVYSDIEYCEKQLGNYEGAYKYSTKRMSMLEGFKS